MRRFSPVMFCIVIRIGVAVGLASPARAFHEFSHVVVIPCLIWLRRLKRSGLAAITNAYPLFGLLRLQGSLAGRDYG